jgi:hypothetical protein
MTEQYYNDLRQLGDFIQKLQDGDQWQAVINKELLIILKAKTLPCTLYVLD